MLIIGSIIVVIILIGILLKLNWSKQETAPEAVKDEVLPQTQLLPTVEPSVVVTLTSANKKEVLLTIAGVPPGTTSIEYELSYLARGDLPKGVIGTIPITDEKEIERKITLGTCSSGRCVYDQGVEKVKVSLKFNGDYGSRLFEKEFEI